MKYRYQSGETIYEVSIEGHGDGYRAIIDGVTYDVEVLDAQPGAFTLRFGAAEETVHPKVVHWGADGDAKWLSSGGCSYRLERPRERRRAGAGTAPGEHSLRAPMPAQVRAVQVADGETLEAGQTLVLLEAMKMEIRVASPRAGRVARVLVKPGDRVERDQVLVELA
jgi:biotin carboxyl carrier protein